MFTWWIKVSTNVEQPKSQIVLLLKKGIPGYTRLDCTQETTETMSVINIVAFIESVKAFDSELNNDMHVCSNEP